MVVGPGWPLGGKNSRTTNAMSATSHSQWRQAGGAGGAVGVPVSRVGGVEAWRVIEPAAHSAERCPPAAEANGPNRRAGPQPVEPVGPSRRYLRRGAALSTGKRTGGGSDRPLRCCPPAEARTP